MTRVLWVDAGSGVAGDMLAGAFVDLGVPLDVMQHAVDAVLPGAARLSANRVTRAGMAAVKFDVADVEHSHDHRHLSDIEAMVFMADIAVPVAERIIRVFRHLGAAEAAVHGTTIDNVHFHEVGAVDSIADIVATCAALQHLAVDELLVGPLSLGSGIVNGAHGEIPVPTPAALRLVEGFVAQGAGRGEMSTPTGLAILTALGRQKPLLPAMTVHAVGVGAGTRDPQERANVVRLVLGDRATTDHSILLETNIDDMDPRLWPDVIARLIAAGANDAWLTPILMKKGRPAHTLSVLCTAATMEALQEIVFAHTTSIGMRVSDVAKMALERRMVPLEVDGQQVRAKVAGRLGTVYNVSIEFEDIAAAAAATGRTQREVLDVATEMAEHIGLRRGAPFIAE